MLNLENIKESYIRIATVSRAEQMWMGEFAKTSAPRILDVHLISGSVISIWYAFRCRQLILDHQRVLTRSDLLCPQAAAALRDCWPRGPR
jgi:hypothetical protein